jgi:metallo-beta-lactamase family protein
MDVTVQFLGGVGTVTGSKFLVRSGDSRVLVDCGMYQGLRELRRRNWDDLDTDVRAIDAVVLTHAHLDHCGYLPLLVKQGFRGPILATEATIRLAEIVLRDSAKLNEEDADYAARKGFSKHRSPAPLFALDDVEAVLPLFQQVPFAATTTVAPGMKATLLPSGHILGSSIALIEAGGRRVVFSGDLGRPGHPLLVPPAPPPAADAIVCESTYADREHSETGDEDLAAAILRTIGRGGVVLIPAFAVDRTEVVLMALRRLMQSGRIPKVPVHVDSPMALRALDVYRDAVASGARDIRTEVVASGEPFDPGDLRFSRSAQESMAINEPREPCVIISASGMGTGGRVVHHLKHLLPGRRNAVLLVGYQAVGTRGRDLVEGARQLKMHGQYVPVRAEVVSLGGMSVHADADELMAWLGSAPATPAAVYVVHGEPESSRALIDRIRTELDWVAVAPRMGEIVSLGD